MHETSKFLSDLAIFEIHTAIVIEITILHDRERWFNCLQPVAGKQILKPKTRISAEVCPQGVGTPIYGLYR